MSRKKVWTFESICRAARRRAKRWGLGKVYPWQGSDLGVKCARGYCPLGVVFTWGKRRRPDPSELNNIAGLSYETAIAVYHAADFANNSDRPRMLKLLGVKT